MCFFQQQLPRPWQDLLTLASLDPQPTDWLGIFSEYNQEFHDIVIQMSNEFSIPSAQGPVGFRLPNTHKCCLVGIKSRALISLPNCLSVSKIVERVYTRERIILIEKGEKDSLRVFKKYLGRLSELTFDPGQWKWRTRGFFHSYTAKKGRLLRRPWDSLIRHIYLRWHGLLLDGFQPNWKDVWYKERLQKEVAFLH